MAAKKGSNHHASKMTEATVRAARRAYAKPRPSFIVLEGKRHPITVSSLARKYNVSRQTMSVILKGDTWKHVES
jgi:hypothetical protein